MITSNLTLLELQVIFDSLLQGNGSVITPDIEMMLSSTAVDLQTLPSHNGEQVEQMKYLLMICNVLYNRTDMEVLPVEDGVYDLLLECYKKYDEHFQVGSAVVQFKTRYEKDPENEQRQIIQPIYFFEKRQRDEMQELAFQSLSSWDVGKLNYNDILINPIVYTSDYITKRKHDTKHNHPDLVGTLDKCKFVMDADAIEAGVYDKQNVKILERDFFLDHINKGIITPTQHLEMVVELKYDGISVEADCTHEVLSARTRGDTGIGEAADITPILRGYTFHHNREIFFDEPLGVKFEAIILKRHQENFNILRGHNYVNCRSAIVGLFGASDAGMFREFITLVPLALDREQRPDIGNRIEEIEFLNALFRSNGEPLRYMRVSGTYQDCLYQIKKFTEEAFAFRERVDFMFDGVVVSYVDEDIREKLGRKNFINKYSMAIKFNPLSKTTRFLGYSYTVGQDGRICPMIHYNPVEFFGTIHNKSTGHGLDRFNKLNLAVGDLIKVTYNNDVMPYVDSLDCDQNRNNPNPKEIFPDRCPDCGAPLRISDTGKSAFCTNQKCPQRMLARMTNMLQKLNFKGFAESSIAALNVYSFKDLFRLEQSHVADVIGPGNAENFTAEITAITHPVPGKELPDYMLIGALGFTGIASQTWKLIFSNISLFEFHATVINDGVGVIQGLISGITGIGPQTVQIIMSEYPLYMEDIDFIIQNIPYKDSSMIVQGKKQIRFTGVRNLQLEEQLNSLGYDADGKASVTKQTDILIVPYVGFSSNKTSKVREDCLVVAIDDFKNNMEHYLSQQ